MVANFAGWFVHSTSLPLSLPRYGSKVLSSSLCCTTTTTTTTVGALTNGILSWKLLAAAVIQVKAHLTNDTEVLQEFDNAASVIAAAIANETQKLIVVTEVPVVAGEQPQPVPVQGQVQTFNTSAVVSTAKFDSCARHLVISTYVCF